MEATFDTREFQAALRLYQKTTNKEWPSILNTKGLFISLKWYELTKKAEKGDIERSIGRLVTVAGGLVTRGKRKGQTRKIQSAIAIRADTNPTAPLAALIINKRRAASGLRGIQGKDMKRAIVKLIGARMRGRGFLRAGLLPAIRSFGAVAKRAGSPAMTDRETKQYGRPKGEARIATEALNEAMIVNNATTKNDRKGALHKYSGPAQAEAVRQETASMIKYCEERLKPAVDKFNEHKPINN